MSDDIRVLLVKLADRLHNMRTLHHIPSRGQAPPHRARDDGHLRAARRADRHVRVHEGDADARLPQLEPEAYESITRRLEQLKDGGGDRIAKIGVGPEAAAVARTASRPRSRAARSIPIRSGRRWRSATSASSSCPTSWRSARSCRPRRIATARSASSTAAGRWCRGGSRITSRPPSATAIARSTPAVIHADNTRVEIQIRTARNARRGRIRARRALGVQAGEGPRRHAGTAGSATWSRSSTPPTAPRSCSNIPGWRCTRTASSPSRPKGELIQLPKGATPIDFAYAVHTDLGDQAVGAKINGRVVPLRTAIENGDQVQILRSKAQAPQPNWLNFAITGKARAAIRRHLRAEASATRPLALGRKLYDEIVAPPARAARRRRARRTRSSG